jgi:hypothetical protein
MSSARRRRTDPPTVAARLVLVPAVATALLVTALEAGRARQADDPLFDGPPPRSLARAILDGDLEGAFALVRADHDPNRLIEATMPDASRGRGRKVHLTPMALAAATGNANAVRMLLSAGVDLARPENQLALCLARERHDADLTALLSRAIPGTPSCPAGARLGD